MSDLTQLHHLPAALKQKRPSKQPFFLQTGPFTVSVQSTLPYDHFAKTFALLYDANTISFEPVFADFHINLSRPLNPHFFIKPQVQFLLDGISVFNPLPLSQAFAIFEWGLNWAIGNHCHFYLVIHSGVIEKNGVGLLLPGAPGSGKSTLCAAMSLNGWRLLSDELALIDLQTGLCCPITRPVSLKDGSIDVIRRHAPDAILSPTIHDTQKGSVAYLKAPYPALEPVPLRGIIFPKFQADTTEHLLEQISKARTLIRVAEQSFNYHIHGRQGFELLKQLVDNCRCYDFFYNGDLALADQVLQSVINDAN